MSVFAPPPLSVNSDENISLLKQHAQVHVVFRDPATKKKKNAKACMSKKKQEEEAEKLTGE